MKLLLCQKCWDVFKLDYDMRHCKCGSIKGRYIDNMMAEVSENAISLALGNGSVQQAVAEMMALQQSTNDQAPRQAYYQEGQGRILYAWARPNAGPGNPHTKLIEEV